MECKLNAKEKFRLLKDVSAWYHVLSEQAASAPDIDVKAACRSLSEMEALVRDGRFNQVSALWMPGLIDWALHGRTTEVQRLAVNSIGLFFVQDTDALLQAARAWPKSLQLDSIILSLSELLHSKWPWVLRQYTAFALSNIASAWTNFVSVPMAQASQTFFSSLLALLVSPSCTAGVRQDVFRIILYIAVDAERQVRRAEEKKEEEEEEKKKKKKNKPALCIVSKTTGISLTVVGYSNPPDDPDAAVVETCFEQAVRALITTINYIGQILFSGQVEQQQQQQEEDKKDEISVDEQQQQQQQQEKEGDEKKKGERKKKGKGKKRKDRSSTKNIRLDVQTLSDALAQVGSLMVYDDKEASEQRVSQSVRSKRKARAGWIEQQLFYYLIRSTKRPEHMLLQWSTQMQFPAVTEAALYVLSQLVHNTAFKEWIGLTTNVIAKTLQLLLGPVQSEMRAGGSSRRSGGGGEPSVAECRRLQLMVDMESSILEVFSHMASGSKTLLLKLLDAQVLQKIAPYALRPTTTTTTSKEEEEAVSERRLDAMWVICNMILPNRARMQADTTLIRERILCHRVVRIALQQAVSSAETNVEIEGMGRETMAVLQRYFRLKTKPPAAELKSDKAEEDKKRTIRV